jgi:hypothetical protein
MIYKVGDKVVIREVTVFNHASREIIIDEKVVTITSLNYPHRIYNIEVNHDGIVSENEIIRHCTPLDEALE